MAELFVIVRRWKQPKYPTVGAGRANYGQPHNGGLGSYLKNGDVDVYSSKWQDARSTLPSNKAGYGGSCAGCDAVFIFIIFILNLCQQECVSKWWLRAVGSWLIKSTFVDKKTHRHLYMGTHMYIYIYTHMNILYLGAESHGLPWVSPSSSWAL